MSEANVRRGGNLIKNSTTPHSFLLTQKLGAPPLLGGEF